MTGSAHALFEMRYPEVAAAIAADLAIWQQLLERDAFVDFFAPLTTSPNLALVTDACAGPGRTPGTHWLSGCGVGGTGPGGSGSQSRWTRRCSRGLPGCGPASTTAGPSR